MTHEDLAISKILDGLSPEDQSRVRLAAMKMGISLAEYIVAALEASTETIIAARDRKNEANKTAAAATSALIS